MAEDEQGDEGPGRGCPRLTTTALYTRVAITDLPAVLARCHPRIRARRRVAQR